jgi:hypothetical protein
LSGDVPAPEILEPHTEQVDLSGKDSLEFKFRVFGSFNISYVDFRLYKGYTTDSSSLIYSEQVDAGEPYADVRAEKFENGQTYTIVIKSISQEGFKSDKVFSSFQVIKK